MALFYRGNSNLHFRDEEFEVALDRYAVAMRCYRELDAKHGIANMLADTLNCYAKMSLPPENSDKDEVVGELREILKGCSNRYAQNVLDNHS